MPENDECAEGGHMPEVASLDVICNELKHLSAAIADVKEMVQRQLDHGSRRMEKIEDDVEKKTVELATRMALHKAETDKAITKIQNRIVWSAGVITGGGGVLGYLISLWRGH